MVDILKPIPFRQALERLDAQRLLPTSAGSRRIGELDAEVRERAFFSARVVHTGFLQRASELVRQITSPSADNAPGRGEATMDRAKARLELKRALAQIGWDPVAEGVTPGSLQDLTSDGRLNLILDTNKAMARGFGAHEADQDEDLLAAFPCQELVRLEDREEPRDWRGRWLGAGGALFEGRMIAMKNDPIWVAISAFGLPYEPFDYNSGMGLVDVGYREAVRLGVIERGVVPRPEPRRLNEEVSARIPDDPPLLRALAKAFGDDIGVEGDRMVLKGSAGNA